MENDIQAHTFHLWSLNSKQYNCILVISMCVCVCERVSHLRNDPQRLPQAVQADLSDILPTYVDVAPLRLIEAEQEPHNGALPATTGGTDHQHDFAPPQY